MAKTKERKKRESQVSKEETPEQRFARLATARVTAVIKRLRLVKNLAGPSYKFTGEQVEKISATLDSELQFTLKAFAARLGATSGEEKGPIFTL